MIKGFYFWWEYFLCKLEPSVFRIQIETNNPLFCSEFSKTKLEIFYGIIPCIMTLSFALFNMTLFISLVFRFGLIREIG